MVSIAGRQAGTVLPHLTVAERVARGKAARAEVPRTSHALFEPSSTRPDPIELLAVERERRDQHAPVADRHELGHPRCRLPLASYLGNGSAFERAILQFSDAYADQNERDYQELAAAAKSGKIAAESGL